MVAVHASIMHEKRLVQPRKVETQLGWHNRGCVWNKLATMWAGKEDQTSKRKYQALEDEKNSLPSRVVV